MGGWWSSQSYRNDERSMANINNDFDMAHQEWLVEKEKNPTRLLALNLEVRNFSPLLSPTGWLNAEIIDAMRVHLNHSTDYSMFRFHIFDSHLLPWIIEAIEERGKTTEEAIEFVSHRDRRVRVTEKDRLFFPIFCKARAHWTLLEVDLLNHAYRYYDSLKTSNVSNKYVQKWSEIAALYLSQRWNIETFDFPTIMEAVPQQPNTYDCGLHTLRNLEIRVKGGATIDSFDMLHYRQQLFVRLWKLAS